MIDEGHGHHDHDHKAAPMVEEITDYEVLEIAVRELAIEHGLFTAEDHRKFTEWAEVHWTGQRLAVGGEGWTDPAFKARVIKDAVKACKEIGLDWAGADRIRHPERLYEFHRARRHAYAASRDRLHAVLLLSAPDPRHVARMVSHDQLPAQAGPLAA